LQPRPGEDECAEKHLWKGRTDVRHFGGSILVFVAAAAMLMIATLGWMPAGGWFWCFVVIVAVGLFGAFRIALRILGTRYRLTTERLFIDRGIIRQTIDQIELIRVDDLRVTKGLIDRVFGLGNVEILSTDFTDKDIKIDGVADADAIAELIRVRMRTARRKSLFIENL